MAVGWKKKSDSKDRDAKRANMTSMELARAERKNRENREKAIAETNKRATDLFKQVCRILNHKAPATKSDDTNGSISDQQQVRYQKELRRWRYECLAVIRLASEDMRTSKFTRKYGWNADWEETGCLTMAKVINPDKPENRAVPVEQVKRDLKYIPLHQSKDRV